MLCVLFAFALAYDSEHRQCASQLAGDVLLSRVRLSEFWFADSAATERSPGVLS